MLDKTLNLKRSFLYFFVAGLFMLPYDSIPHIMPTTYRPASLFLLVPYIALFLASKKWKFTASPSVNRLVYFFLYTLVMGIPVAAYYSGGISYIPNFFISFFLGFLSFIACYIGFSEIARQSQRYEFVYRVFSLIGAAYMIPIMIGTIELASLYGPLPDTVKSFTNMLFGGWQLSRICMTTAEASFASTHLLFVLPVFMFLYTVSRKRLYLVLSMLSTILFISTFSMKGILLSLISFFIYTFIKSLIYKSLKKFIFSFISIGVVIIVILILIYHLIKLIPSSYVTDRIVKFKGFDNILFLDGSVFIRVGYPLIAFEMFKENLVFGLGAGGYYYSFFEYLTRNYQKALNFWEVQKQFKAGMPYSVSIGIRVLTEFGIIGGFLFYSFFVKTIKNVLLFKKSIIYNFVYFWTAFALSLLAQTGNYAYLPLWVILSFLAASRHCLPAPKILGSTEETEGEENRNYHSLEYKG